MNATEKYMSNVSAYVTAKWSSFKGTITGLNVWPTEDDDAYASNIKANTNIMWLGGHLFHGVGYWYSWNIWA
jgi:hypothetical protein